MKGHYTFIGEIIADENWQKFVTGLLVAAILLLMGLKFSKTLASAAERERHIVPAKRFSLLGFFDFFVEAFVGYHDSILGKENRKHISFTGTLFVFILISNFLGLVPGLSSITTTVWVNVALALAVLIYFNYQGVKENGFINYFKHFCGPVWWLAWFILPLEFFSILLLRPFTLNLRLYWNITADHLVLGIFTDLAPFAGLPFYLIGSFVAFMQAFVFTTLTMVYILLAIQHEEEH